MKPGPATSARSDVRLGARGRRRAPRRARADSSPPPSPPAHRPWPRWSRDRHAPPRAAARRRSGRGRARAGSSPAAIRFSSKRRDPRLEVGENVHEFATVGRSRAPLSQVGRRRQKAAHARRWRNDRSCRRYSRRRRARGIAGPASLAAHSAGISVGIGEIGREQAPHASRPPGRAPRVTFGWRYMRANRKALMSRSAALDRRREGRSAARPAAPTVLGGSRPRRGDPARGSRRSRPR